MVIAEIISIGEFLWKMLNEGLFNKIKGGILWLRNSPIKMSSLILYFAITGFSENKFNIFCKKLEEVYKFEINKISNDLVLTHTQTIIVSREGIQIKIYLIEMPSITLKSIRENYQLKLELMSKEISYKSGIRELKKMFLDIISCAQNAFNSEVKVNYRMRIKKNKKLITSVNGYKIHIYGDRATIESTNLDNLGQVILLAT